MAPLSRGEHIAVPSATAGAGDVAGAIARSRGQGELRRGAMRHRL